MRWRRPVAAAGMVVATVAVAAPLATDDRRPPVDAGAPAAFASTSAAARLATGIAAAAHTGLVEQGTAAAQQALDDCRKGDYPGGGSGLLSLPAPGRTNAQGDHCWR